VQLATPSKDMGGNSTLVTLAVCARFTLRYEAQHVLSWIAHHHVLGVRQFFLYLDRLTSNTSDPLQSAGAHRRMLAARELRSRHD
jgi:hypothetical protein